MGLGVAGAVVGVGGTVGFIGIGVALAVGLDVGTAVLVGVGASVTATLKEASAGMPSSFVARTVIVCNPDVVAVQVCAI